MVDAVYHGPRVTTAQTRAGGRDGLLLKQSHSLFTCFHTQKNDLELL